MTIAFTNFCYNVSVLVEPSKHMESDLFCAVGAFTKTTLKLS
jgi:hypothetical protein